MEHLLMLVILKLKEIAEKLGLIADYVVEEGKSGVWAYKKWNNGTSEAWRSWNGTKTISNTYAGWYYYGDMFSIPQNIFKQVDYASINALQGTGLTFANVYAISMPYVYFHVISSQSDGDAWQNIYMKGRWK